MNDKAVKTALDCIDSLDTAYIHESLGFHAIERLKSAIYFICSHDNDTMITFESSEDTFDSTIGGAVKLLMDKVEAYLIFKEQAYDAMCAHENGEETEFDPFKMEEEADDMRTQIGEIIASLNDVLGGKKNG